jgi:hypothetical protein
MASLYPNWNKQIMRTRFSLVAIIAVVAMLFVLPLFVGSSFAANAASFSAPLNLSNDGNNAQYPNVQSSGSHVYVVWTEKSHGINFRASSDGGSSWSPPTSSAPLRISPAAGGSADFPLMAADGANVYVVWSQTTSTDKISQIYFASSSNYGASFNTAKIIDKTPSIASATPVIDASSGNYVYVAWDAGGSSYATVSANNGAAWSSPFKVSGKAEPQIAGVGSNVYAISDGGLAVSHDAGSTWKITSLGKVSESWIVASGTIVLAAWETKSSASVIYAIESTDSGSTFGSKKLVSSATPDAWAPMVGLSGSNSIIAYRTFPGGTKSQEYVTVSTNSGASWGAPTAIGIANRLNQWPFDVAVSGTNVYIMWSEKVNIVNNDWQTLVSSSSDSGASWSSPTSLSTMAVSGAQAEHDIATGSITNSGGAAFAAWENNATTTQIYFSAS